VKSFESYNPRLQLQRRALYDKARRGNTRGFCPALFAPGFRAIDCGCGPGTITLDLAQRVAPGEIVGIDREHSQLALAREAARDRGLANATFQIASLYELPFPNASFDFAFAHALFEHLKEPLPALVEIRRVLKPGGWCVCAARTGRVLFAPDTAHRREAIETLQKCSMSNGGDVYVDEN